MQVKVQAINDTFHHKLSNYSKYSATTGSVLHICKQLYFGFRKVFQARPLYFVYEVLKPTQRSGDSRRKFFFPRLPSLYPSTLLKGVIVLLRNVLFQILGRSLKQIFIFYLQLQEFVQIWVSFDNLHQSYKRNLEIPRFSNKNPLCSLSLVFGIYLTLVIYYTFSSQDLPVSPF